MNGAAKHLDIKKLSLAGVIVTFGIVFGDIGTSPLYVMKAIVSGGKEFNELLIYGSMSCIFWTLTLQTTIKYVVITLRVNNKGEGGIYALFALMKKKSSWAAVLTMIGASALLADGVITPAITVTSSIEGLRLYNPDIPVIAIVLVIFAVLFYMQQYGTNVVGGSFGPIMVIWFSMLGILGFSQLVASGGIGSLESCICIPDFLLSIPVVLYYWALYSWQQREQKLYIQIWDIAGLKISGFPGFLSKLPCCLITLVNVHG